MATIHQLKAERKTLHGHFSMDLAPVLTIASGDTVVCDTLDAGWGLEPYVGGAYQPRREFEGRDPELDGGHAMTGPIAIEGAKAGQTLVIEIRELTVGAWGFCLAGGWKSDHNDLLKVTNEGIVHAWELDAKRNIGRNHLGYSVTLKPFLGVLGMPPAEPGIHSTTPPRATGGNLDCKDLVVGSTLYLPIAVDGGLLSVGDGHAAQGHGEISGTAIECPMARVELKISVIDNMPLSEPIAKTPDAWITMAFDTDLTVATYAAMEAMFDFIQEQYGVSRLDAIALASVTVDMHVTQAVNRVRGAHASLPHGAIR
ncbi:MAG: acetamidase/formamidase family protein [Anaerolineaceae bacterium]|nr:acetamidase/formamidase family protein [Anaerolineaceae bacterium]